MRDALIKAYNCIYFALPSSSRQMGPSTCELAAKLFLEKKGSQDDPMRLAYCTFCVAALEGDCPLENAAVLSPCVCQCASQLRYLFKLTRLFSKSLPQVNKEGVFESAFKSLKSVFVAFLLCALKI